MGMDCPSDRSWWKLVILDAEEEKRYVVVVISTRVMVMVLTDFVDRFRIR